jgi:serine/threonine protein kinase
MSSDPRIGSTLAGYRIDRLLGRGGMSVVYLAEQQRPRRNVALKLLAPELAQDPSFRNRFEKESELAASLDHPNVIPIYEVGEIEDVFFIAMRYVKTVDLAAILRDEGQIALNRVVHIGEQTASALDAAHSERLVHRDVKPGNILVATSSTPGIQDHVYLSDFGIAKRSKDTSGLTQAGYFIGTVDYVSPEQIAGTDVDGRTDQYALACVLFQCLTGKVPFDADDHVGVLFAHLSNPPPSVTDFRPDLSFDIDEVIARGMAKAKEDRFESCSALTEAVSAALLPRGTEPSKQAPLPPTVFAPPPPPPASPPSTPPPEQAPPTAPSEPSPSSPKPPVNRRRVGMIAGVVTGVVAVLIALIASISLFSDKKGDETGPTALDSGATPESFDFSDDFSDSSSGWGSKDQAAFQAHYVDGQYVIAANPTAVKQLSGAPSVGDVDVQVETEPSVFDDSTFFGVTCRGTPGGSPSNFAAYYFLISARGAYDIGIIDVSAPRGFRSLSSGTSPVIATDSATNVVSGSCKQNGEGVDLLLKVNGEFIDQAHHEGSTLPPGKVGLAVAASTSGTVSFDNFKATETV